MRNFSGEHPLGSTEPKLYRENVSAEETPKTKGTDSSPAPSAGPTSAPAPDSNFQFRSRDSLGALRPSQAGRDAALARGYAQGMDEAHDAELDHFRTVLVSMLEAKFGELDTTGLDRVEAASQSTIDKWMIAALKAKSLSDVFDA